jgi:hypothetical protein
MQLLATDGLGLGERGGGLGGKEGGREGGKDKNEPEGFK